MLKSILFPAFITALYAVAFDAQIYLKAYIADPKTPFNWRIFGVRVGSAFLTGALGGLGARVTYSIEP